MEKYNEVRKRERIWIWGMGEFSKKWIYNLDPELPIVGICDSSLSKKGKIVELRDDKRLVCCLPDEIDQNDGVIIAVDNNKAKQEIKNFLVSKEIAWCDLFDAVEAYYSLLDKDLDLNENLVKSNKIVKFIDCLVPIDKCNLRCSYCYLKEGVKFQNRKVPWPSARVIRKALSRERLGGIAFINLCGDGETLLYDGLIPLVSELIKEGHYVQIVTNATITGVIEKLVDSDVDFNHLFVKCSLQYLELKYKNMLDIFSSNVHKLWEKGCSISVEVTPHDELIPYINELKEYSMEQFGALPHITTARNEEREDFGLLTKFSTEEYKNIWQQYDSALFDFKIMNVGVCRKGQYCMAGKWSFKLDLASGELRQCSFHKTIDFIYHDVEKEIKIEKVGEGCILPYCYNCHAYLTWGTIKDNQSPTYFEMRDRKTLGGEHWIGHEMGQVMKQRLGDNN